MFLIGSRSLPYYGDGYRRKITKETDYDLIGDFNELNHLKSLGAVVNETNHQNKFCVVLDESKIEFDATGNESNLILASFSDEMKKIELFGLNVFVCTPKLNFIIKKSHLSSGVHFEKNFFDYLFLLKRFKNTELNETETLLYRVRKEEAEKRRISKINLNKKNEDFFEGGKSLRKYVHDDLHKAIAFHDNSPVYEKCKYDMSSAKIEKSLFEKLSSEDKLRMVQEEAMVIGLERFMIPTMDFSLNSTMVYRKGLMKLSRDLTKGWFQEFIFDNLLSLTEPSWDYMTKFKRALDSEKIGRI